MNFFETLKSDVSDEITKATSDVYYYYLDKAKKIPSSVVTTLTNSNLTDADIQSGKHAVPESESYSPRSGGEEMPATSSSGTNAWKLSIPMILVGVVVVFLIVRK